MQYWIIQAFFVPPIFDYCYHNGIRVTKSSLALKEGDICILCSTLHKQIIRVEIVHKASNGWIALKKLWDFSSITAKEVFNEEEVLMLESGEPKKISENTYHLLHELYRERFSLCCRGHRGYLIKKRQRDQARIELISQLQSKEIQHIFDCTDDDYLNYEPSVEPPNEIKCFMPEEKKIRFRRNFRR